jgi:hypothetical protein
VQGEKLAQTKSPYRIPEKGALEVSIGIKFPFLGDAGISVIFAAPAPMSGIVGGQDLPKWPKIPLFPDKLAETGSRPTASCTIEPDKVLAQRKPLC